MADLPDEKKGLYEPAFSYTGIDFGPLIVFFFFAIYLKLTIAIYEKLPTKCVYKIKNSLYIRLI